MNKHQKQINELRMKIAELGRTLEDPHKLGLLMSGKVAHFKIKLGGPYEVYVIDDERAGPGDYSPFDTEK